MTKEKGLYEKVPGSGTWWIQYWDQHGNRRRESIGTKKLAREALAARRVGIAEGREFPARRAEMTLAEWGEEYMAQHAGRLRDPRHRAQHLRVWNSHLGKRRLAAIRPEAIEKVLQQMAKDGLSASTRNRYHATLKRVLSLAMERDLLATNPAAKVKLAREPVGRTRFLDHNEEERVLAELPPDEQDMVVFAIATGMRQSEQFGLRWGDIGAQGEAAAIPLSKSGSARWVRLNATARAILQRRGAAGGQRPGDRIWPIDVATPRAHFQRARRRAGVAHATWHDLRHTFASRLAMVGVDLYVLQQLLGHKTAQMTQRYAHLSASHLQAAVERLDLFPTATKTATLILDSVFTPQENPKNPWIH